MARRDALLDEGRAGRQRQRRLRDVVGRVGEDARAEGLDLLLRGGRADQHAVAAGALDLFHDELGQVVHHLGEVLGLLQLPGGHVLEDRLLAEVEADHVRHIGVGRLVVGHAGAERVGERHVAGAVHRQEARHAEEGIRAERQRVEEGVVHAAVDHVDALPAAGGAHVDVAVLHEEVGAFDQFHAHLLGEEGVLEVRAVVLARREHHDGRLAHFVGRRGAQGVEQQAGIVLDGQHGLRREQLRKQPHHHLAVLEHVRHAGGGAQVVLEHEVAAVLVADQVDAGDLRVDLVGQVEADHRHLVGLVGQHLFGGDHPGLEDGLPVVDVVEEPVQRGDALLEALGEHLPLGARDDARNGVERDQALGAGFIAVDGEGDAHSVEQEVGFAALLGHPLGRHAAQPGLDVPVMLTHAPPLAGGQVHFIVMLDGCGHGGILGLCPTLSNPCATGKAAGLSGVHRGALRAAEGADAPSRCIRPPGLSVTSRGRAAGRRRTPARPRRRGRRPGRGGPPRKSAGIRRARRPPGSGRSA